MSKMYCIEIDGELKGKNVALNYIPILNDKEDLDFIISAYPKAKKVKIYLIELKELKGEGGLK